MKKVKITYTCDYCGKPIDTDDEAVKALWPGHIDQHDKFEPDMFEEVHHYHDYCLENLLTMRFEEKQEDSEPEEEEQKPEEEPATSKKKVDHGRIVALYTARDPWSIKDIADDVGCSFQTVINHLKKEGLYK